MQPRDQALELGDVQPRPRQVATLEPGDHAQPQAEQLQTDVRDLPGEGHDLTGLLLAQVDVRRPGDRVAVCRERAGECARIPESPAHGDRLLGELASALVGRCERQRYRQPRQHLCPGHGVVRPQPRQSFFEQIGLDAVPQTHLEAGQAGGEAQSGKCEEVGVIGPSRDLGRLEERLTSPVELTGGESGLAGEEHESRVRRGSRLDQLEGAVTPSRGVLVGQHRGRGTRCLLRGCGRSGDVDQGECLDEVVGALGCLGTRGKSRPSR